MTRKTILIIILLISSYGFAQSVWRKEADFRKNNSIKERKWYYQNLDKSESNWLFEWELFDENGRSIEKIRYASNGKIDTHYKFEYIDDMTRYFITMDKNGKEQSRFEQEFDLSLDAKPLTSADSNGLLDYEYDNRGNLIKIWRIKENPRVLQSESSYDDNDLLLKKINRIMNSGGGYFYQTNNYERDDLGNVIKITTESNGKVSAVSTFEYIKYGT